MDSVSFNPARPGIDNRQGSHDIADVKLLVVSRRRKSSSEQEFKRTLQQIGFLFLHIFL